MVPLDLDSEDTWHIEFKTFCYSEKIWNNILSEVSKEPYSRYFLSRLTCDPRYLDNEFAVFLRKEFSRIMSSYYLSLVGYHACRIRDFDSYRNYGILSSKTSNLIEEAKNIFGKFSGLDAACADIPEYYLKYNQDKVFFLMSGLWEKSGNSTYGNGSELIHAIANKLGQSAIKHLAKTGKPTLIKCSLPISWLDEPSDFPVKDSYSNALLLRIVEQRMISNCVYDGMGLGFSLSRSIPPEHIMEFIDVSDCEHYDD